MKIQKIEGLIAAPFTGFGADGSLDVGVVDSYAQMLVRNGVRGVFVGGSNGEGQSMSTAERMMLAEAWRKHQSPSFRIIVHTGSNSLPEVKALLRHAQEIGSDAAGLLAPSYHKPATVTDLAAYLTEVAAVVPELPVYYYHIPVLTGVNLPMLDLLETIDGRVENFAGIKYTSENLMEFSQCLEFQNRKYDMLYGRDELLLYSLIIGARGAVGSTYNFAAPIYVDIIRQFLAGNLDEANRLQQVTHRMIRELFRQGAHPIVAQKVALQLTGIACAGARLPIADCSEAVRLRIQSVLQEIGWDAYRCR